MIEVLVHIIQAFPRIAVQAAVQGLNHRAVAVEQHALLAVALECARAVMESVVSILGYMIVNNGWIVPVVMEEVAVVYAMEGDTYIKKEVLQKEKIQPHKTKSRRLQMMQPPFPFSY